MGREPAGNAACTAGRYEVRVMWRAFLGLLLAGAAFGQQPVDFNKQIRPIFEQKCLPCHDAEKAAGGLRMHTRAAIAKVLNGSLVAAIDLPSDKRGAMPPAGPQLPASERDLIRKPLGRAAP